MAGLKLNHLYKVYPNGVKAVSDFTMEIKDKEFIVFVGPSGCGKSTTLRMIAGLEEISAGELKIDDAVVNDVEPKDRDIAMVFQNYALYPHMTVYQNMTFGLRLRKTKDVKRDKEGNPVLDENGNTIPVMRHYTRQEMDEKVRAAAEILGITDYLERKPAAMSGGQRQRVALGRAIVREPKAFLLDEPLSNLDAKLRTQMRSEISKLHQKLQTTFIYVTHDQVEAMTMGTRIVVMKAGFVQQIDKPRNLYDYPVNKFVAGFIGTPQMNFYDGRLKKEGDKVKVTFEWERSTGEEELQTEANVDGTSGSAAEKRSITLEAPADLFLKTDKRYLYGVLPVTFGIRPEHVSANPDAYPYKGKVRVTFVEELGTESLIYADIDVDNEEITVDSPSKIIIKAPAGTRYDEGEVIDVSYDLSRLHIFDKASEATVSPRIPENSYMTCGVKDNKIIAMGTAIDIPSFAGNIEDGNYILSVPTKAIKIGSGNMTATVIKKEKVEGDRLIYLKAGKNIIFALDNDNEVGDTVSLSIDMKQIFLSDMEGNIVLSALPVENSLLATMIKYKQKTAVAREGKPDKMVSAPKYDFLCNGVRFACDDEMAQSIINGTELKLVSLEMDLRFSPYAISLSDDGIAAKVESILDYGDEKFAKCLVGDRTVYLSVPSDFVGDELKFSIDTSAVSVIDTYSDVRLV